MNDKIQRLRELLTKDSADSDPTSDRDSKSWLKLADAAIDALPALLAVAEAAKGLSGGQDWNKGTHAITHGYRQKLLDALAALEEL